MKISILPFLILFSYTTTSELRCFSLYNECNSRNITCNCTEDGLIYSQLSKVPYYIHASEYEGLFRLEGECSDEFPFASALKLLNPLLQSQKITVFNIQLISIYCNLMKIIRKDDSLPCSNDKRTTLNLSDISSLTSVTKLDFFADCLNDFIGNVSQVFPNLEEAKCVLKRRDNLLDKFGELLKLKKLDLSDNEIQHVPKSVFHSLPALEELNVHYNKIQVLPEDLFQRNVNLKKLNLGVNRIKTVPKSLFSNQTKLKSITLSFNSIEFIPQGFLDGLTKLEDFTITSNKISEIPLDLFKSSKSSIRSINLSSNNLTALPKINLGLRFSTYGNDLEIDLGFNKISVLELPIGNSIYSADKIIMSNNCIREVTHNKQFLGTPSEKIIKFECAYCCLESFPVELGKEVRELYLSGNNIKELSFDALKQLMFKRSFTLDLRFNKIETLEMFEEQEMEALFPPTYDVSLFHKTRKILMEGNPFVCDCKIIDFLGMINKDRTDFVRVADVSQWKCREPQEFRGIEIKMLNRSKLYCQRVENCPLTCHCFEYKLDYIFQVNCSGKSLTEFPTDFSRMFNYSLILNLDFNNISKLPENVDIWDRVTELNLANNKLTSLDNFKVTPKLLKIHLQNNFLRVFDQSILQIFTEQSLGRVVDLSGNPWECNCEMAKLTNANSNVNFINQRKTKCIWKEIEYSFNDIDEFCPNIITIIAAPVGAILVIVSLISIGTVLIINYKLEVKYFLFSKGMCLKCVTEEDVDADKVFDAFVSYSGADGIWVRDVLADGLENDHPSYKLCIHERDWPGGELIPEQIVRSVEQSRRTIIVLTKDFLVSEWSQMEFNVAYENAAKDGVRRVIVVVPYEMPPLESIRDDFRAFLTTTTYLEAKKPHFWRKLRSSMPRRIST